MKSEKHSFRPCEKDVGKRIDSYIAECFLSGACGADVSRSRIQKILLDNLISVDGKVVAKGYKVKWGDDIEVEIPAAEEYDVVAENIPIEVAFEDEHLLVVNKAKGMVVHPAPGHEYGTLVNALLYHCKESGLSGINGVKRPGIVHRLDKDTSGLIVVAKDDLTHRSLAGQFSSQTVRKNYHAVVHGKLKDETGIVERDIGRDPAKRKKFSVAAKRGRAAVTEYRVLEWFELFSYLELVPKTGRTHQLRVHMASIGHAVAGDTVYGPKTTPKHLGGQCLHAKSIEFLHPITDEIIAVDSELPDYFSEFVNKLRRKGIR